MLTLQARYSFAFLSVATYSCQKIISHGQSFKALPGLKNTKLFQQLKSLQPNQLAILQVLFCFRLQVLENCIRKRNFPPADPVIIKKEANLSGEDNNFVCAIEQILLLK